MKKHILNFLTLKLFPINLCGQIPQLYNSPQAGDEIIKQTADTYGLMVLPSGDTPKNMMWVKIVQAINEAIYNVNNNVNTILNMNIENYKWFSKGYCYTIFETIKTIPQDSIANDFSSFFFFHPQEHLYLDTDPNNLAILDSLWNIDHKILDVIDPIEEQPNDNSSYNLYPNPVGSN